MTMVVTIVLLLAGFVVILLVYSQIAFESNVDRTVCHESVILRGTLSTNFELKETVPLKCKTEKICVSSNFFGKGDCKDELGNKYSSVKISSDAEKKEQEVKSMIAREMAACWSMMGEGKIQVFTGDLKLDAAKEKCVVCSRISFDDETKKELNNEINGM